MTFNEVLVWLIIGALAGSLAGLVVTRTKEGYGPLTNILIGLIGAAIGGFIFNVLNIDLGLGEITISFDQVAAAFVGALILLFAVSVIRR